MQMKHRSFSPAPVVHGGPALWVSLHLPLEYVYDWSLSSQISEWLARTGGHPLSLSILGSNNMEEWEEYNAEGVDAVLGVLVGCSDRWQTLDLTFNSYDGLQRLDVCAPALRAIKTKCDPEELIQMKLLTTPSLRAVAIGLWQNFDRYVPALPLCWEHLTSLSFDCMGDHQMQGLPLRVALGILKRCPRLVHFETDINISFELAAPSSYTHGPPVALPSLHRLIICRKNSSVSPKSLGYLLQQLLMPRLRCQQLPRTGLSQFALSLPFLGNLAARSPHIEDLSVDLAGLALESLLETLRGLPSLQKLVVIHSDGRQNMDAEHTAATAHQLFQSLAPPDPIPSTVGVASLTSTTPLCPLLRELQITECRALPSGEVLRAWQSTIRRSGCPSSRTSWRHSLRTRLGLGWILRPSLRRSGTWYSDFI
ncbi:F-box domain-containing protein [Mycena venus]|uniref:F-box domain-containing protein n=1 Tax=Mycena venus TaxID=2733690 RepID=A0A8H6X270_9AGAR|nr:F-box domain-containing protein [Mycena venus]